MPVILALYTTVNNWELLRGAGFFGSLAFHTAHSTIPWWINASIIWLLFVLVPWFAQHRILLICTGTAITSVVMLPYANAVSSSFYAFSAVQDLHVVLHSESLADPFDGFLVYFVRAAVLTVGVNWVFDQFLGLPRYRRGYMPAAASEPPAPASPVPAAATPVPPGTGAAAAATAPAVMPVMRPRFLDRLPESVTADAVLALKAEQHYISVLTAEKSYLTLYRFSDALAEMGHMPGLQVHRSYWVRPEFIERIRSGAGKMTVHLRSGLEVPVSGPYKVLVRQMARQAGIPILPVIQ